jgi:cardiolipin synthase A/B
MTISYFAPDARLLKAFTDAAARGVEVILVMPSHSDSEMMLNLGRSYYSKLLEAGVKIYERRDSVMHAKTAVIDGVWSTVGSTNLDARSLEYNNEVNAVILGAHFATQMNTMFSQDIRESDLVSLEHWRKRSWWRRAQERFARLGAYWL